MNKADEKKVLITLWVMFLGVVGAQLLTARDSTNQQPLVDSHQTYMIEQNTKTIDKMDRKLDKILDKLP